MKIYFKKKSAYKKTNHQSIVSPVKKLQVKKKKNSGLN